MIETKEVTLKGSYNGDKHSREEYNKCHNYIQDLTAFGWQPTQQATRRISRSSYDVQIMARETTMPHYNDYRRLENDYETSKGNIMYYNPMEFSTVLLLLLLLILPGVLYIVFKIHQKSKINENNQKCNFEMQSIVKQARSLS